MVDVGSASAKLCMQSAIYAGIVVTSAWYSENCRQPMLLQPVCIYGCFALLGLISAVHSQITQHFNAMFSLSWALNFTYKTIVLYVYLTKPMTGETLHWTNE